MNRLRALVTDQRGFTLIEMLVATAIMGFVLSAALLSLQAGTQASDVTTGRAEAQSSIRFAMDRMIADMRAAGNDPTIANFDPIDSASMNSFTVMLNTDLNGNGTLDAPVGTCDAAAQAERVRYRKSGTSLMRAVMTNATTVACETTLIGGVQSLIFTYKGADDATTSTAASVRAIDVALTIQPESMGTYKVGTMAAAMTDRARLRNR
jgi:prepilin-type N-terminal cleavage/methylation domain-containing protein